MKGGFKGFNNGGMGGLNINNLMKQAEQMQAELAKSQEELSSKEFSASSGGGAVTVKLSGNKIVKEIKLKKEIVDPEDIEMLEDLIISAFNEAIRKIDEEQQGEMSKFNLPKGLF